MAVAAPAVCELRQRIGAFWPRALDDTTVLVMGFCGFLGDCGGVVDLVCSHGLSTAIAAQPGGYESISLNGEETFALLAAVSQRAGMVEVCRDAAFVERAARLQAALECTLAEPAAAAVWRRPTVQLACVVAMQAREPPFALLDAVFGSIVRADVRRVEDLHYESRETAQPAIVLMSDMLEAVAQLAIA